MRKSTIKSIAAIALTGAGSLLIVGFQAPDTPIQATTTATSTTAATTTTGTGTTTSTTTSGTTATSGTTSTSTATAGTTSTATAMPAATATTTPTTSSTTQVAAATTYADGTWTGAAVQEPWGTFQVQAVVSGGQITSVVVVSSPQDGHSSRINSQAIPVLTEAAIASQGASIDMISGATWTSQSYATSLQAALDQAMAATQTAG